jgi:bifunctional non-homologous end joining protein LigD
MLSRTPPARFISPCLPSPADQPPTGTGWIHEIKHDGYRLMARRDPIGIPKPTGDHVLLYAFDLLELDGQDLRREPLETRKATLASLLRGCRPGVRLNEHLEHNDAAVVFRHACALGCEGIVSKRLGSIYRSGKCKDWLKFKNPAAPAVKREAEEDWGRERSQ